MITGHRWGKGEPIHASVQPLHDPDDPGSLARIRRIRFSNVLAERENSAIVYGPPSGMIEDVLFDYIELRMKNSKLQPTHGGNFDLRAAADPAKGLIEHDVPGLLFGCVERLRIRTFRLSWDEIVPGFFSYGIESENFCDVEIQGFEGRQAEAGGGTSIALRNGSGISIRDCRAAEETDTFLSQSGASDQRLFVNHDLSQVEKAFEPVQHGFTISGNLMPK